MRLITARQAWHDAYYTPWDSVISRALEQAKLGRWVQTTERNGSLGRIVHQVTAGRVQHAIASLPANLQCLGHHLYAPVIDTPTSNAWEEAAVELVYSEFLCWSDVRKLSREKLQQAEYVARGVLLRYRHMVQGGQGANPDPMAAPRVFRAWLADHHGVVLDRRNWSREWGWILQELFRFCGELDARALSPVSALISHRSGNSRKTCA